MEHAWPFVLLAFAYGCCVGSFLNVVIFRLSPLAPQPEPGRLQTAFTKWFPLLGSMWWDLRLLSNPPSHCPKCDHKLRPWDNIPVLAWLWLRGKCRDCKQPISIQYPIIEAICGLIFVALFFVDYQTALRPSMGTLQESWPMLLVQFVLLGALLGATGIDARFYIIPHVIPYSSFFFTIIFLPWAVYQGWMVPMIDRVPTAGQWLHHPMVSQLPWETGFGYGGAIGLVIAILLLKTKLLPMSFADTPAPGSTPGSEASEDSPPTNHGEADVPVSPSSETKAAAPANAHVTQPQEEDPTDPETWYVHPHLRREMLKELLFLLFPTIGAIVGVKLWGNLEVEVWVSVLGSILTGALVGAGLVWYIRVLGSLAFGKEAMGLGDVHLMLAIGAVLGWMDVTVCFFVAPFSGILAAVLLPLASKFTKKVPAVLPYGPHLAVAAFAMLLFRVPILTLLGMLPR